METKDSGAENYDSIFFFMGRANPPTMGHINVMYKLLKLAALQTTIHNPLPMIFLSKTSNSERLRTDEERKEIKNARKSINSLDLKPEVKEKLIKSLIQNLDYEPVKHEVKFVSAEKKSEYPDVKHRLHENPLDFEEKKKFVRLLLESYVQKKASEIRKHNSMLADRLLDVYSKLLILPATGLYHCFGQVASKANEEHNQIPSERIYYMYGVDERKVGPKTCLQKCTFADAPNSLVCSESEQMLHQKYSLKKKRSESQEANRPSQESSAEAIKNASTVFASASGYMCVPLSRTQGEGANISGSGIRLLAAGHNFQDAVAFKKHYEQYLSPENAEKLFLAVHSGITSIVSTVPIRRYDPLPNHAIAAAAAPESDSTTKKRKTNRRGEGGTRKKKRKKGKTCKNKKKRKKIKRKRKKTIRKKDRSNHKNKKKSLKKRTKKNSTRREKRKEERYTTTMH